MSVENRYVLCMQYADGAIMYVCGPDPASARASAAVSATASGCQSQAATEHPCAANWRTSSRPMPEPPPVTTASLEVNEST